MMAEIVIVFPSGSAEVLYVSQWRSQEVEVGGKSQSPLPSPSLPSPPL